MSRLLIGVAAALALSSSAMAADRFDLKCLQGRPGTNDPVETRYSFDLVAGEWCLTHRCHPTPLVSFDRRKLVFDPTSMLALGGSLKETLITEIDRLSGKIEHTSKWVSNSPDLDAPPDRVFMSGTCQPLTFTPMPKPKF